MGASGYYPYEPSKAGASIVMLLFGAGAFVHLWQMFKLKTWFFTAFLIGAFSWYSPLVNSQPDLRKLTTYPSSDGTGLHFPIDVST